MMKVLIVSNSSSGLYNFRKELITELINRNNEIVIVTAIDSREEQLRSLGVRIISVGIDRRGINPINDFRYMNRIRKIINLEKPDIVITYTVKPNIYAGFVCKKKGITYIANITGLGSAFNGNHLLKRAVILLYRHSLSKSKCVFFENSSNMNIFIENSIVKKEQAVLLNGAGVNLDYYSYKEYPHNDRFSFLFIGRIMKEKGIDELFDAFIKIKDENKDCVLELLGGYDERYKSLIQEYVKEGWLNYHGYQTDVRPFIENCDCFVLPSYHEGMANTNLESASSGRPIITSNIPGCREAVIDGVTGYLCEPRNADALYGVMRRMLEMKQIDRAEMGKMGRRHMEENFDKQSVVELTIEHIIKDKN